MRNFHSAVIERNAEWAEGNVSTEPYEAGWASEAICFVRVLAPGGKGQLRLSVQISPDGMQWVDEGTTIGPIDNKSGDLHFARVREFGNWLRVAGEVEGSTFKVLVYWALKS